MPIIYLYNSEEVNKQPLCEIGKLSFKRVSRVPKLETAVKVSKFVNMVKYGLLSDDIELNPGSFDLRLSSHGKGLMIGQWNVQHLTDVKFEQLSHSFNASKDSTSKVDILILAETFCNDKRPDLYYQIQDFRTNINAQQSTRNKAMICKRNKFINRTNVSTRQATCSSF